MTNYRKSMDWQSIAPAVAERLLGAPNTRGQREWRWGNKGSRALRLDTGIIKDYEAGESYGVLGFVESELGVSREGALDWLKSNGFLYDVYTPPARYASTAPQRYATGTSAAKRQRDDGDIFPSIKRCAVQVDGSSEILIRRWLAHRNLWRTELPLPPSIRWLPASSSVFRDLHQGAGALAIPLASLDAWIAAYPDTPQPAGVQLINIDAEGNKALDRPADYAYRDRVGRLVPSPGLDKRNYGRTARAVWCIGDIRPTSGVAICEGAADGLAIAAREADAVICTLTTPRPAHAWSEMLSAYPGIVIWADNDPVNKRGERPGIDAGMALARALRLRGRAVRVGIAPLGKDAADTAAANQFMPLSAEDYAQLKGDLRDDGLTPFEAARMASIICAP